MYLNNIRKFRIQKNMNIKDLANLSDLSIGYICHLEKGTRKNPSYETMKKISNALGKEISEIFE